MAVGHCPLNSVRISSSGFYSGGLDSKCAVVSSPYLEQIPNASQGCHQEGEGRGVLENAGQSLLVFSQSGTSSSMLSPTYLAARSGLPTPLTHSQISAEQVQVGTQFGLPLDALRFPLIAMQQRREHRQNCNNTEPKIKKLCPPHQ